jgi:phosphatidate cytidylyltransferase
MIKDFIILFFVCFFISLIATIYQTNKLRDKEEVKAKWIKFWVYIFIIFIVSSILYYNNYFLKLFLLIFLGLRSIYELWLIRNTLTNKNVLIIPILIIILATIGMFYIGRYVSLWLYAIVFLFDGFSQIGGQLIRSPKITPNISNGKTFAGLMFGTLIAFFTYWQLSTPNYLNPGMLFYFLRFIFIITGCFFGDLGASYIKRKAGIKDFKTIIPGHGGVLDRFDSFYGCYFMYVIFLTFNFIIFKYVV